MFDGQVSANPPDTGSVRVLVVGDDPLARAGLTALLAGHPLCSVVGQLADDPDLLADLTTYRAEVVIWDLGWVVDIPSTQLERLSDLAESAPPLLALIAEESQAAAVWSTGVRGMLMRDADIERLAATVLALAQGLAVLDPALSTVLLASPPVRESHPPAELTPRELEVLQLVAEGLPNKAIARRLGISEHTVKFHINALLGKLGAQSRTEAVVRATRLGLIFL